MGSASLFAVHRSLCRDAHTGEEGEASRWAAGTGSGAGQLSRSRRARKTLSLPNNPLPLSLDIPDLPYRAMPALKVPGECIKLGFDRPTVRRYLISDEELGCQDVFPQLSHFAIGIAI